MDISIMDRHAGGSSKKLESSEDCLPLFLSKIEKRKRLKERILEVGERKEPPVSEDRLDVTESKDKFAVKEQKRDKKRKKSLENNAENSEEGTETNEICGAEEPFRKKKKRKLEELCDRLKLNESDDANKKKEDSSLGFTVLGNEKFQKKTKVKRVLPYWLAKPSVVSGSMKELSKTIHEIPGVDENIVKLLEDNNITHFFPVQSEVIPWILTAHKRPLQYRPNDLCVSAPTGSGKTLAFVLPVIQILKSRIMRHIRALVVLPVKDLALQVYQVFKEYCKGTDLKVMLLTGQGSFASEQQELIKTSVIIGPYNAVDIVVATPGRLVDHLVGTPEFSLRYLQFLVIDEADRIMDSVANDWLYHVEKHIYGEASGKQTMLSSSSLQRLPRPPQKLLFSATLTQDPEKLERLGLFQPKLFTTIVEKKSADDKDTTDELRGDFIGKYTTPAELSEKFCVVNPEYKPLVLYHLITNENWRHVLCFTRSQEHTHRLALLLKHLGKGELKVGEISARLQRHGRDRVLNKFSSGKLNVLVSSDAMARGIDVPNVDYVVSYDMPKLVKTYIHRIGRTGRAGRAGTAVTFVVNKEVGKFKDMLRTADKQESIEEFSASESDLEYLEDNYKQALDTLRENLKKEKNNASKKEQFLKKFRPKVRPLRRHKNNSLKDLT